MQTDADKALSKAKITLMAEPNCVFFATVMLSLQHIWDNAQPTAYTDGTVIGYNQTWFMSLKPEERVGLVLHETLHVAFMHILRGEQYDAKKFNYAADYVINLIILAAGFQLPPKGLVDRQYEGMFTEQVYRLLPDNPKSKCGDCMMDIRPSNKKEEDLKADLDDMLVQAVLQSRVAGEEPGSIPGEIEFYVDGLINPTLPWFRLLRSLMTKFAKEDYSFQRPNRRFLPDYILPGLYSEKVCDMAIGTDTSCSVTDDEYNHYIGETIPIVKYLKPDLVHFIQFDTKIQSVYELRKLNDIQKIKFTGRGGTNVEPLMKWAQKNKPACLIVFSDGEFSKPATNPKVPVLWVVHGSKSKTWKPSFGKLIPFDMKDKKHG